MGEQKVALVYLLIGDPSKAKNKLCWLPWDRLGSL